MQSVSSRNWTRVAVSISYDDNHYTTRLYFLNNNRVYWWLLESKKTANLSKTSEFLKYFQIDPFQGDQADETGQTPVFFRVFFTNEFI